MINCITRVHDKNVSMSDSIDQSAYNAEMKKKTPNVT